MAGGENVFSHDRLKPVGRPASDGRYSLTIPASEGVAVGTTVGVKAGETNERVSDWIDVEVTNGLPDDVRVVSSGSGLEVSWLKNSLVGDEQVRRNVAWYRPAGGGMRTWVRLELDVNGDSGRLAATLPGLGDDVEIQVRAVYTYLGRSPVGPWIRPEQAPEPPAPDPAPEPPAPEPPAPAPEPPAPAGPLTDECRPGGGVFEAIGATPYDEVRVPLETHVWFFPTDESAGGSSTGEGLGHAHLLTCVPAWEVDSRGRVVSGFNPISGQALQLDLRIQAHLDEAKRLTGDRMKPPPDDIAVRINLSLIHI